MQVNMSFGVFCEFMHHMYPGDETFVENVCSCYDDGESLGVHLFEVDGMRRGKKGVSGSLMAFQCDYCVPEICLEGAV